MKPLPPELFRYIYNTMNLSGNEDRPRRVLLADDHEIYRCTVAAMITQHGYEVDTAGNAEETLAAAEQQLPDVFVLDVQMPGNEDLQLIETLKNRYPNIPVIVLTGFASLPSALNAVRLNIFDYIKKDENSTRLLRRIDEAFERRRLQQRLIEGEERYRRLAHHLESVREEERRRLSMDLHDEIGQIFTALKIDLAIMKEMCACKGRVKNKMDNMNDLLMGGIRLVHTLCRQLRPGALDDLGLGEALEGLVAEWSGRNHVLCTLSVDLMDEINRDDIKTAVFRIVQEALTNIFRHAQATEANIQVISDADAVSISVSDNGKGMPENKDCAGSFGLLNMIERAEALGGTLEISSVPGKGTCIEGCIPFKPR